VRTLQLPRYKGVPRLSATTDNVSRRSITNVLEIRHVLCRMDLSPISIEGLEWAAAAISLKFSVTSWQPFHRKRTRGATSTSS
jgi:hypothetical protein